MFSDKTIITIITMIFVIRKENLHLVWETDLSSV